MPIPKALSVRPAGEAFSQGVIREPAYPRQNGQDIDAGERLFPKMLADRGYYCGLAGKLHLSACHPDTGRLEEPRIDDGYHVFRWSHHPQPHHGTNWPSNAYNQFLLQNGRDYITPDREDCPYVQTGVEEKWHQTAWCADEAIAFMETARTYGKDWMFSLNCFDPHHPFDPPADYLERYLDKLEQLPLPNYEEGELAEKPVFQQKDHEGAYDTKGYYMYDNMNDHDHRLIKAAYWAMVDLIDKQVGRLLDYLDKSGQREDTLILFHSDHGENLGDHGMYLKGPYFYENNVHVPLIISWQPPEYREDAEAGRWWSLPIWLPHCVRRQGSPPLKVFRENPFGSCSQGKRTCILTEAVFTASIITAISTTGIRWPLPPWYVTDATSWSGCMAIWGKRQTENCMIWRKGRWRGKTIIRIPEWRR